MKEEICGDEFDLTITEKGLRIEKGFIHEVFHFDDLENLGLYYGQPKPLTYSDIEYSGGTGCTGLTGQKIIDCNKK